MNFYSFCSKSLIFVKQETGVNTRKPVGNLTRLSRPYYIAFLNLKLQLNPKKIEPKTPKELFSKFG